MNRAPRTRSARARVVGPRAAVRAAGFGVALAVAATLAGCTGAHPATSPTATSTSGAGAHPSATPTGGAGALVATALHLDCADLAPDSTVASAYAGMTAEAEGDAPAKSDAAVIGSYGGTVCSWSSGTATMTLAVGRFDDDSLTRLKNSLVRTSNAVPTYDGEGYFDLVATTGTAEAFTGAYWVVATSDAPAFAEPGGAEPLVDSAIALLKKRG